MGGPYNYNYTYKSDLFNVQIGVPHGVRVGGVSGQCPYNYKINYKYTYKINYKYKYKYNYKYTYKINYKYNYKINYKYIYKFHLHFICI